MSWANPSPPVASKGFPFREGEDEYDLKMRFAAIVARNPKEQLTAGYKLFCNGPADYGRAMQSQAWLTDPVVQAEISRLSVDQTGELLPTDEEIQLKVWNTIQAAGDPRIVLQGAELLAKMRGMLKVASEGGSGGNTYIQNVIKLPQRVEGDQEEALFEARFEAQQLKLVQDARAPKPD